MRRPLGVSACLIGSAVRYDGTDRRFDFVAEVLARRYELVAICPEVELGLGVPRETIQLEGDPERPRLFGSITRRDLTEAMTRWAVRRAARLRLSNLVGYVWKSRSPSCGPREVKHWRGDQAESIGSGLFFRALREACPELPMADERELAGPKAQAAFLRALDQRARELGPGPVTGSFLLE